MKQLFENAVGAVPSSTVDVQAIVRKRRKIMAWQRSAGAFAGVVILAVTVGIGMSVVRDRSETPPLTPSPLVSVERPAQRVERAWMSAAKRVLPGGVWKLQIDGAMIPIDRPYQLHDGSNGISRGVGSITIGGVESGLNFTSERPETKPCRFVAERPVCSEYFPECNSEFKPSCTDSRGPNGEYIRVKRFDYTISYRHVGIYVDVFSADNTRHVEIMIDNRPGSDGAPLPVTTKLAVTAEQALDIILGEPELWY